MGRDETKMNFRKPAMNQEVQRDPDRCPSEPVWPIGAVYLLHGKGGTPEGTVKKLATVLEQHWPGLAFIRPALPHSDPMASAESSVDHLLQMQIPQGSLLVGISLGGTVAAKLQKSGRDDLKVIAISSPAYADDVVLYPLPQICSPPIPRRRQRIGRLSPWSAASS